MYHPKPLLFHNNQYNFPQWKGYNFVLFTIFWMVHLSFFCTILLFNGIESNVGLTKEGHVRNILCCVVWSITCSDKGPVIWKKCITFAWSPCWWRYATVIDILISGQFRLTKLSHTRFRGVKIHFHTGLSLAGHGLAGHTRLATSCHKNFLFLSSIICMTV